MGATLSYRYSFDINSCRIAVHMKSSEQEQEIVHHMEDCLRVAFCMQCSHWSELRRRWIKQGYFTESLFERKEFRSNKVHRALCLFCSNFNLTVSKADIFNYVWPDGRSVSPGSVSVMVYDLRILLSGQNVDIVNVRGVGYRLEPRRLGSSV